MKIFKKVNQMEKKYFPQYFSLDFPGVEVNAGKREAYASSCFSEKKDYSLHFHHFSIFNNHLIGQQGFDEAFCVFFSFREIFSGYSLMFRKQMVFNK